MRSDIRTDNTRGGSRSDADRGGSSSSGLSGWRGLQEGLWRGRQRVQLEGVVEQRLALDARPLASAPHRQEDDVPLQSGSQPAYTVQKKQQQLSRKNCFVLLLLFSDTACVAFYKYLRAPPLLRVGDGVVAARAAQGPVRGLGVGATNCWSSCSLSSDQQRCRVCNTTHDVQITTYQFTSSNSTLYAMSISIGQNGNISVNSQTISGNIPTL